MSWGLFMKPSREQEVRHQNMLWYEELHNLLSLTMSNPWLSRNNESESEDEKNEHIQFQHIWSFQNWVLLKKGLQNTKQYLCWVVSDVLILVGMVTLWLRNKDTNTSLQRLIKKGNQLEHVSTEADIIHDRTRFRGSEYLVWLVITQWIGSPSVDRSAIWFGFFITYFRRYLERSGGVL